MLGPGELRGALIPAVPVPFDAAGDFHASAQRRYVDWMATQPIAGVAVWAHTGRGLRLPVDTRAKVLTSWREGLSPPRFVIAAAGATPDESDPSRVLDSARGMARHAAELGADAVLVHPPAALRGRPDIDSIVLDYHAAVAEAGLPLVLFYLYEAAGGISYPPEIVARLLNRPEVLGIKVATLDSVMTFQDLARLIRAEAPEKVLITGEDRFLGYSLMAGAEGALIGMGAACTSLQADLLNSHRARLADRFLALSEAVDDLAVHTFRAPMEGYILRMLRCLAQEGIIPPEAAHDPWGPTLEPADLAALGPCLDRIRRGTDR